MGHPVVMLCHGEFKDSTHSTDKRYGNGTGATPDRALVYPFKDVNGSHEPDGGLSHEHSDLRKGEYHGRGIRAPDPGKNEACLPPTLLVLPRSKKHYSDGTRTDVAVLTSHSDHDCKDGERALNKNGGNENSEVAEPP